jgi:hypothetical protein
MISDLAISERDMNKKKAWDLASDILLRELDAKAGGFVTADKLLVTPSI